MRTFRFLFVLLFLVVATPAAALTQPNGAAIPSAMGCNGGSPTGLAPTFACVCDAAGACNIGGVCSAPGSCPTGVNAKCETTLAHVFNDNTCIPSTLTGLDPAKDAALTPETFRPSCGLTFKVVSRGTAIFGDVFGWYNATGQRPQANDLHPMLACNDGAGKTVTLDVRNDPAYKGGAIGFFLLTPEGGQTKSCAGGDCCASVARYQQGIGHLYFSERKYNADNAGANPFIHLLVFDSKITARKFYFAWEDIYGGSNNDFTDLVTSVDGVECSGGGEPCDTGNAGRCARGAKACKNGALTCLPLLGPGAEVCNGVDDDCNGKIDDGATCPNPGEKCHRGRCVASCATGEFPCPASEACDGESGFCLPKDCVGVRCPEGQLCRGGACKEACAGVVCPHGTSCVGNVCLNLCEGVKCAGGEVCKGGVCVAGCSQCGGLQCGAGLVCDVASGDCVDTSCTSPCAEGTYCEAGQCKDACAGAKCPEGQTCSKGSCINPASVGPQGASGNLAPTGPNGSSGDSRFDERDASGCGCEAMGRDAGTTTLFGGVLTAVIGLALRRQRRGRRA